MNYKNQCDGCRAGMLLHDGLHYLHDHPIMSCEKEKYLGTDYHLSEVTSSLLKEQQNG